jgi:hypothetical protein
MRHRAHSQRPRRTQLKEGALNYNSNPRPAKLRTNAESRAVYKTKRCQLCLIFPRIRALMERRWKLRDRRRGKHRLSLPYTPPTTFPSQLTQLLSNRTISLRAGTWMASWAHTRRRLRRRLGVRQERQDSHVTVGVFSSVPLAHFSCAPSSSCVLSLFIPGEQSRSKEIPKEQPRPTRQPHAEAAAAAAAAVAAACRPQPGAGIQQGESLLISFAFSGAVKVLGIHVHVKHI